MTNNPTQAEAQQPSDGLAERPMTLTMPNGDVLHVRCPRSSEWAQLWDIGYPPNGEIRTTGEQDWKLVDRYGLTAILVAFHAALKAQQPSDELAHPSDQLPFASDRAAAEYWWREALQARAALKARTSPDPETVELLREAAEYVADHQLAQPNDETLDLARRIDAHLSNTPGQGSDQHG